MARADRYTTDVEVENKAEESSNERLALLLSPIILLAGISYVFIGHNIIAGALAGIALGLNLYGVPAKRKTHDEFYMVKEWSRPIWLRVIGLIGAGAASYYWMFKTPEQVEHSYNLIAAGVSLALAIIWTGFGNWKQWRNSYMDRRERRRPKTPDEDALYRFGENALRQANLTATSDIAGKELIPEILSQGLDERGRALVNVAVIPGRQSFEDYERHAENIASAWGVPRVIISKGKPRANGAHTVNIQAVIQDTRVKGTIPWEFPPNDEALPARGVGVVDYVSNIPMGKFTETGDDYSINLQGKNFVFAGLPGGGKSSFANALIGYLTRHPDVRIAFIDMKRGVEAEAWAPGINAVIDNSDEGEGIPGALEFISQAVNVDMAARYARMKKAGVKNAWARDENGNTFLGPKEPVKILIIDECSELFPSETAADAKQTNRVLAQLKSYVQQGRAAGYVLLISTQYPTYANLPTVIRENCSDSFCFPMKTDKGVSAALGTNFVIREGLDPTKLSIGEAILVNTSDYPEGTRVKISYITEAQSAEVVKTSRIAGKKWLQVKAKQRAEEPKAMNLEKPKAVYPVPPPQRREVKWTV